MSTLSTQVIIIGAGVAGYTLAGLLGSKGIECIIIEAAEKSPAAENAAADPRALALTHASRHIIERFAAWRHLPPTRSGCFRGMHVWDENGEGEVAFDSAELCQPTLGYIVEQSVLQAALQEAIEIIPAVRCEYATRLLDIEWQEDSISVRLSNEQSLSAKLLVAADGMQSVSRRLAGIDTQVRDYRQHALACQLTTALSHGQIARQRFLSRGPLAFLPLHDEHQCAIVWSSSPEHVQELMQLPDAEFHLAVQESFEHRLGEISASRLRKSFPLRGVQAERYCSERLALIGDAAHVVHPLAGQGANLALLDAASLAELITQAEGKGRDIGSQRVLRAYARWRGLENRKMMIVLEGFKYLFENQTAPLPLLRNQALNIANSIVPLKHTIMRHAMGLSGDLPAAARGNFA